ncbi:MAG TPA: hypothetical protein ENK18_19480 [Deltaproteobacteria bacterium]|nr:hypothetical protein [Deltaproteobacteria bacterium]
MADAAEHLAGLLLEGLEHLRHGRAAEALGPLQEVCGAPELARAGDLEDVRARAHALLAQALLESDRPLEAAQQLEEAQRLAVHDIDLGGRRALAELGARIEATITSRREQQARAARLSELSVEQLETRVRDPVGRVDVLIRKVNAEIDVGRSEVAAELARRVVRGAVALGDPRLEVLARLSLARADPGRATIELQRALARADRANEPNLVTAVVRSAELHGIAPETLEGPRAGEEG